MVSLPMVSLPSEVLGVRRRPGNPGGVVASPGRRKAARGTDRPTASGPLCAPPHSPGPDRCPGAPAGQTPVLRHVTKRRRGNIPPHARIRVFSSILLLSIRLRYGLCLCLLFRTAPLPPARISLEGALGPRQVGGKVPVVPVPAVLCQQVAPQSFVQQVMALSATTRMGEEDCLLPKRSAPFPGRKTSTTGQPDFAARK